MNKRKFIRKSIQITKSDANYIKDTADAFGITQTEFIHQLIYNHKNNSYKKRMNQALLSDDMDGE